MPRSIWCDIDALVLLQVKRNRKRHPPLNKFVAVYIMRVGSGKEPQGIVTGEDGSEYVRVWPKITMKDTGPGMTFRNLDQTKGRDSSRQAAVKFSTGPQSWGAKHGYRTFVRVGAASTPQAKLLVNVGLTMPLSAHGYTVCLIVTNTVPLPATTSDSYSLVG